MRHKRKLALLAVALGWTFALNAEDNHRDDEPAQGEGHQANGGDDGTNQPAVVAAQEVRSNQRSGRSLQGTPR